MKLDAGKKERVYKIIVAAVLFLLFAERMCVFIQYGTWYKGFGDSGYYVDSGLFFARTGIISYQMFPYPTAMIMPAMPVIIAGLSFIFGQGDALWIACRVLWCVVGVLNALVIYKTVCLFAPRWCGIFSMLFFFIPNIAWMGHVVQTETPYMCLLSMCVYYTFLMGRSGERKYFVFYMLSFMAALMFRANILPMLLFTAVYVLLNRREARWKELFRRSLVMAGAMLVFVIPWTIRNYNAFDAFIPVTYGAGDPTLLGTYQGQGYPTDEELDYTEMDAAFYEKYSDYYDENRVLLKPECSQYLLHEAYMMKAEYRMRVWFDKDPVSFLKSYLFLKPASILNWVWSWERVLGVPYETLTLLSWFHFFLCAAAVLLSLIMKKLRMPILFLTAVYWANIYITSLSFVSDRYAAMLSALRFTIAGMGAYLIAQAVKALWNKKKRA